MTFPLTLLDLAGAIALLLGGSHMVQTGVQRAFGPQLKSILGGALRNRFLAFFAGAGVTAPRVAHLLTDEKITFREAISQATEAHFESLRAMRVDEAQASSLYLDLLRELKAINSLIVGSAAYPVLERTGELLPSRRVANTP